MNSSKSESNSQVSSLLAAHPCFNQEARHTHARIHLPVAPRCNMQCNYCNRKYSCVNESRPGITSAILRPVQAIEYLRNYTKRMPNLSVVGIAGPGDPFACANETLETLRLVKADFPHLLLCVASNGLNLLPYVEDLASVGLSHITVTVNAVDPVIGAQFYEWMSIGGRRYEGVEASSALWKMQNKSIQALAARGVVVKVNTIYVPGINDKHISQVAQSVSVLGASILNIMPLLPTAGTPFAAVPEPSREAVQNARLIASCYLPQMTHCSRCRADAVGMIGEENTQKHIALLQIAALPMIAPVQPDSLTPLQVHSQPARALLSEQRINPTQERPYIAVASRDGVLINRHLGEAAQLSIYKPDANQSVLVDTRFIATEASGAARWLSIIAKLQDCCGILVSGAGAVPRKIFAHYGITVAIADCSIDEALRAIAIKQDLSPLVKQSFSCGTSCRNHASGCA
jgi:nitrogen fixation protein NifB